MAALKYCTVFRTLGARDKQPWLAIGPVFDCEGRVNGVVFTVLSRNMALHRSVGEPK
jgi:hypothetical protein